MHSQQSRLLLPGVPVTPVCVSGIIVRGIVSLSSRAHPWFPPGQGTCLCLCVNIDNPSTMSSIAHVQKLSCLFGFLSRANNWHISLILGPVGGDTTSPYLHSKEQTTPLVAGSVLAPARLTQPSPALPTFRTSFICGIFSLLLLG